MHGGKTKAPPNLKEFEEAVYSERPAYYNPALMSSKPMASADGQDRTS